MQRLTPKASKIRQSGSQISLYGNGSCDNVPAPLILIAMLSCAASANTFGRSAQGCGGGGGSNGCCSPRWSITNCLCVGISRGVLAGLLEALPAQEVDRQGVPRRGGKDAVEAGIGGIRRNLVSEHDPDADRALRRLPLGDRIGDCRIGRVDRLDQSEPAGMRSVYLDGVAGVVAI